MAKILLIGSSQYRDKFIKAKERLESEGHEVRIPAFDDHPDLDDLGVCKHNRSLIEWSEEVHLIWDRRSSGTVFDFGMVFMARKPLVIEYLEEKTFAGVMQKYAKQSTMSAEMGIKKEHQGSVYCQNPKTKWVRVLVELDENHNIVINDDFAEAVFQKIVSRQSRKGYHDVEEFYNDEGDEI